MVSKSRTHSRFSLRRRVKRVGGAEVLGHALEDRLRGLSRDGAFRQKISPPPFRSLSVVSTARSTQSGQSKSRAAVTFNSRDSNSKDAPRCKRFTVTNLRVAKTRRAGGDITSSFNNPSISMSTSCGSFNRCWMSQKNLMHTRPIE